MDIFDVVCGWILSPDKTRVLVVQNDDGLFSLPGGAVEPGEAINDAVVREVYEETNLQTRIDRLIAVAEGFKTSVPGKRLYFHFLMDLIDPDQTPMITRPNEILQIKWISWNEANDLLSYLPQPAFEMVNAGKALVMPTKPRYP